MNCERVRIFDGYLGMCYFLLKMSGIFWSNTKLMHSGLMWNIFLDKIGHFWFSASVLDIMSGVVFKHNPPIFRSLM